MAKTNLNSEMDKRLAAIAAAVGPINKKYGDRTVELGKDAQSPKHMYRIPTGSIMLDRALGGGLPAGRMVQAWGDESSSKTTIGLLVAGNVQKMCMRCFTFISGQFNLKTGEVIREGCACGKNVPGIVAVVEPEGTFSYPWAKCLGVNTDHIIYSCPDTTEQAVDVVEKLIKGVWNEKGDVYEGGGVDFLLFDSIAACVPLDEIQKSAEDSVMGKNALAMNRGMRIWIESMNERKRIGEFPTIFTINQLRQKIGLVFGSNETRPGGMGQKFANSIEIKLKRTVHEKDKKDKEGNVTQARPVMTVSGVVNKNKTARPGLEFEFSIASEEFINKGLKFHKGEVIELNEIQRLAEMYGLMGKDVEGKGYFYKGEKFEKQKELYDAVLYSPEGLALVKQDLMELFDHGKL